MSNRVYISNVFPDGNKGGAAITSATIQAVEGAVPDAEITLIATQVKPGEYLEETHRFTRRSHPKAHVTMPIVAPSSGPFPGLRMVLRSLLHLLVNPRKSSNSVIRGIAEARLVVSKGGYVFVERESIRQLLRVWLTAFPLIVAHRAGVKTAAIGATVGPFKTWHSRALNRWILRRVDLLVPRDDYSYQEALTIGVPTNRILQLPDVVFSHPGVDQEFRDTVLDRVGLRGRRYAAVTVLEGPRDDVFLPALEEVLRLLLN